MNSRSAVRRASRLACWGREQLGKASNADVTSRTARLILGIRRTRYWILRANAGTQQPYYRWVGGHVSIARCSGTVLGIQLQRFTGRTAVFLGMDVGTGGTRAVLVNEQGQLVASASSEHEPFRTPHPGWAEQDPEDWWRAAQEAIRGVLAEKPGLRVDAVGLTGQMHGAVMLDKDGKVL